MDLDWVPQEADGLLHICQKGLVGRGSWTDGSDTEQQRPGKLLEGEARPLSNAVFAPS